MSCGRSLPCVPSLATVDQAAPVVRRAAAGAAPLARSATPAKRSDLADNGALVLGQAVSHSPGVAERHTTGR